MDKSQTYKYFFYHFIVINFMTQKFSLHPFCFSNIVEWFNDVMTMHDRKDAAACLEKGRSEAVLQDTATETQP